MDQPILNQPVEDRPSQAQQDAVSEIKPVAGESREAWAMRQSVETQRRLEALEEHVCASVETTQRLMGEMREALGVDAWYELEERNYLGLAKPELNDDGTIKPECEDAHKTAGISSGLFRDNCTVISAVLYEALTNPGGDPVDIVPRGRRKENKDKKEFTRRKLREMLDRSGWHAEIGEMCDLVPRHSAVVLRQSWESRLELVQSETGEWSEAVSYRGMTIRSWPLLNVYISHPLRRKASEQDTVIWVSSATLGDLAASERVWRMALVASGDEGMVAVEPIVEEHGRFVGLERLRRELAAEMETEAAGQPDEAERALGADNGNVSVSVERPMRVLELQGRYPVGNLMRAGKLTPDLLRYFGIQFKMGDQEFFGEQAARMADRMLWHVTVAKDISGKLGSRILELRPCPYRHGRTELLGGYYIPGKGFYGISAYRAGRDVERHVDKVMNDVADILDSNAKPKTLYRKAVYDTQRKAEEGLASNEPVGVGAGLDIADAITYVTKPYDGSQIEFMDRLIEIANTRMMVSASMKGGRAQTESDTLGEAQQQVRQNERRIQSVIYRLAGQQIVVESARRALEDLDHFMSDVELADEVRRVAGEAGLDAKAILPTADEPGSGRRLNLADEFEVRPAAQATISREVAVQFLIQMYQLSVSTGDPKAVEFLKSAVDWFGLDPENFFSDGDGMMSPKKEFLALLSGDRPEPTMQEDAMAHLQEHQMQKQMLLAARDQYLQSGMATEAVDGWLTMIDSHIEETTDLAQAQMAAAMAQAQQAAAAAPAGKPGKSGAPPPEENKIVAGQQAAVGMPQGGM